MIAVATHYAVHMVHDSVLQSRLTTVLFSAFTAWRQNTQDFGWWQLRCLRIGLLSRNGVRQLSRGLRCASLAFIDRGARLGSVSPRAGGGHHLSSHPITSMKAHGTSSGHRLDFLSFPFFSSSRPWEYGIWQKHGRAWNSYNGRRSDTWNDTLNTQDAAVLPSEVSHAEPPRISTHQKSATFTITSVHQVRPILLREIARPVFTAPLHQLQLVHQYN